MVLQDLELIRKLNSIIIFLVVLFDFGHKFSRRKNIMTFKDVLRKMFVKKIDPYG